MASAAKRSILARLYLVWPLAREDLSKSTQVCGNPTQTAMPHIAVAFRHASDCRDSPSAHEAEVPHIPGDA